MKKILMGLTLIGLCHFGAEAQTKNKAKSKSQYNKNYKMCATANGYNVCPTPGQATKNLGRKVEKNDPTASLRMMDTYTHLGYNTTSGTGAARNSRMRVSYEEDGHAPYKGEESMINDGVQKNINRNINYLDQSVVLPPNDGGVSNRR